MFFYIILLKWVNLYLVYILLYIRQFKLYIFYYSNKNNIAADALFYLSIIIDDRLTLINFNIINNTIKNNITFLIIVKLSDNFKNSLHNIY